MARRALLPALLSWLLQSTAVSGAGVGLGLVVHRGRAIRGSLEAQAQQEQQPGFLERNLAWIAPVPYLEGKAVALARRADLSKLFPEDGPKMEPLDIKAPEMRPMEPLRMEPLPESIEIKTTKSPLVNGKGKVDVSAEKLASAHPVVDQEGKVRDTNAILISIVSTASTLFVWLVLVLTAAFVYRYSKDGSEINLEKAQGTFKDQSFAHGPFACFEDMDVCCWSFWCGAVQWSDSMGAVGATSFWAGLALFILLQSLNILMGALMWVVVTLVFWYFRQDMRRKLEMQNNGLDMAKDYALWCFCCPCAIAQEARQVKAARQLTA